MITSDLFKVGIIFRLEIFAGEGVGQRIGINIGANAKLYVVRKVTYLQILQQFLL
jgi:hypothetical protein